MIKKSGTASHKHFCLLPIILFNTIILLCKLANRSKYWLHGYTAWPFAHELMKIFPVYTTLSMYEYNLSKLELMRFYNIKGQSHEMAPNSFDVNTVRIIFIILDCAIKYFLFYSILIRK